MIVIGLSDNLIQAKLISGKFKNETVLIPNINSDLIEFRRLQFPVKLAFAMTINKSQGQTFDIVGINLEKACFSHGQLYVPFSRVGNPNNLMVYAPTKLSRNIVYPIISE